MLVTGPPASPWSRRWRQQRKRSSPRLQRQNPTSPRVDGPAPVSRSSPLDFVAHFVGAVALLAATCRRHRNRVVSACLRGERGGRSPGWLVRRGCPGPPDPSPEQAGAGSSRMTSGTTSRDVRGRFLSCRWPLVHGRQRRGRPCPISGVGQVESRPGQVARMSGLVPADPRRRLPWPAVSGGSRGCGTSRRTSRCARPASPASSHR